MKKRLLLFARLPLPGAVKSRLASDTGPELACELYNGMLKDTLVKAAALADMDISVFWASNDGTLPDYAEFPELSMSAQSGSTLGERMQNALESAFQNGSEACCIIGTDSPDLPPEFITEAFRLLERNDIDVVFGPAEDGGYYLTGMKQLWSGLFEEIPWGTSSVLSDSLARAERLELKSALLPLWYDIDTIADLQRLSLSQTSSAPHTHDIICRMKRSVSLPDKEAPL